MARSLKKGPFVADKLMKKIELLHAKGEKAVIQTWSRSSTITPIMIGHTIAVHNGRDHIPITVTEGMVGYRLKDFVPTHTFKGHPKRAKATKYRGSAK